MKKTLSDLINIAPRFSRHKAYFEQLEKAFIKLNMQDSRNIVKRYGKERVGDIISGKFPPSEETENLEKEKLSEKELKKYNKEGVRSLMCLYELSQGADDHVAFYYSFIIYLFSDFEIKLNELCKEFSNQNNAQVTLKDLKGSGLERALLFLKKVAMAKLPKESVIKEIILIRDVRNTLAHAAGYTSDAAMIKRLQSIKQIEVTDITEDEEARILFGKEYCKYGMIIMQKFFNELARFNQDLFYRAFK